MIKDLKLSDWAKNNGIAYMKAYRDYKSGKIENAYADSNGRIFIHSPEVEQPNLVQENEYNGQSCFIIANSEDDIKTIRRTLGDLANHFEGTDIAEQVDKDVLSKPQKISASFNHSNTSATRRNQIATQQEVDRFPNLEDGVFPHVLGSSEYNSSLLTIKDCISLCKKAYFNVAIFRNVIDLMTEFTVSDINFEGGNKKSKKFFELFFKKINLRTFQDKFFREYYRSGNVFVYKLKSSFNLAQKTEFRETFEIRLAKNSETVDIPTKYIILDPCEIELDGNINFADALWYKTLTPYELSRLKTPRTKQDQFVYDGLPQEIKKQIKDSQTSVLIPLDEDKIVAVFYKKQDYEPLAIPLGFPVLDDIEWKLEMKKIDKNLSRKMDQAILLITMGNTPDKGGINYKHLNDMHQLLQNPSVSKTIIADYTTKAEFILPDIANIVDPKKYKQVNEDIKEGLNNILTGGDEKFANQQIKTKIFMQRLEESRQTFLNEFLIPEMERIGEILGLQSIPEPKFLSSDPEDKTELLRIYTRLVELGVLTPMEGLDAIKNFKLPTIETSLESQEEFKKLKDKGLYEPLVGGSAKQEDGKPAGSSPGAPKGAQGPKSKKAKPRTLKATESDDDNSESKEEFSLSKISIIAKNFSLLQQSVQQKLKENNAGGSDDNMLIETSESISQIIAFNENIENWQKSINDYIEKPIDKNLERVDEIIEFGAKYNVSDTQAVFMYHSKKI